MRHLISGVVAAVAVMAAAPAMACGYYSGCASTCGYGYGYSPCVQPRYVAPVATFSYGYGYGHTYYHGYGHDHGSAVEPVIAAAENTKRPRLTGAAAEG